VGLVYPSPYPLAMSSLGYLQITRLANLRPGTRCDRAMVPARADLERHYATRTPLLSVDRQQPLDDVHVLGISHAFELELTGIVHALRLLGWPPLAEARDASAPLVVLGGPITHSNPFPSSVFADVVVLGEAERCWDELLARLEAEPRAARGSRAHRERLLDDLAGRAGFFIPSRHGRVLPPIARAPDALLPAVASLWTPHAELSNMLLIEPERGCHRGCTFCVMRRSTNGGMRTVAPETVLGLIPDQVPRVGLVGAAVTDHPRIKDILRGIVDDRGLGIGISSLRADRLDDAFVGLLARGGYRSLTVALDAPSARLRWEIEKNIKDEHVVRAAELARAHGMRHLKLYVVLGLPGETEADRDELVALCSKLRRILPVVLGVSPFVPKFHTPLAAAPFVGEAAADRMLKRLQRRLAGRVKVRGPGAREAYVESRLSQGGPEHGRAAVQVVDAGGSLGAWRRALESLPAHGRPDNFSDVVVAPTRRHPRRGLAVVKEAVT
jgi:radical SAM superfamily enzyme YgiQ (UPF0313 family)